MPCTEPAPHQYSWCYCKFCQDYKASGAEYAPRGVYEIDQKQPWQRPDQHYDFQVQVGISRDKAVMMSIGDLYGE